MPLLAIVLLLTTLMKCGFPQTALYQHQVQNRLQQTISIGPCRIVLNPQCPDPDVTFFMYSADHPENPEPIYIATHVRGTNLEKTSFDPQKSSKVIIHGYNSNMFLSALTELRKEYLKKNDYNIFVIDWSPLNQSPCYPAAVWNARHVGTCVAQLIDRIKDMGAEDIHVIGFSLGAHITNYLSLALRPYILPRITGLDPALPGYITVNRDQKLDKSDAQYVDVYHTNAFMQGKAEESGHVDFYFNGGSVQPGCWGTDNFFSCNHHRAPLYYAESINSDTGFYGWRCTSYFDFLAGRCPTNEIQVKLGESTKKDVFGTYMVITAPSPPFAVGHYNITFGSKLQKPSEIVNNMPINYQQPISNMVGIEKYEQDIVMPSTIEEDELFNEVLNENFPDAFIGMQKSSPDNDLA
ncbi:unnamed protein product [Ceutorhynchus assimilis]|uniref:Lipase domain-containing protein n=1 Tax=Ceutorhynchus assimilis TaxID=467358 RepID=A0A9N9MA07_9CUCU|nr:unnamed protein product [Ceutorhynchus assimilis]